MERGSYKDGKLLRYERNEKWKWKILNNNKNNKTFLTWVSCNNFSTQRWALQVRAIEDETTSEEIGFIANKKDVSFTKQSLESVTKASFASINFQSLLRPHKHFYFF